MAKRKKTCDEPNLFALRCDECGRQLVNTESGYLACPMGHGRLAVDVMEDAEPCGSLFDTMAHEEV